MHRKRILIVENEFILGEQVKDQVERLGYETAAVLDDVLLALDYLQQHPVDLVMMDIQLDGPMNGVEIMQRIRNFSNLPVIFLTGYDLATLRAEAHALGNSLFLTKPARQDQLRIALQDLLGK